MNTLKIYPAENSSSKFITPCNGVIELNGQILENVVSVKFEYSGEMLPTLELKFLPSSIEIQGLEKIILKESKS